MATCCVTQSTLSSQTETIATLTSRLSTCESNYERQGHELQQMKDRQQELTTSVRELARRAATPSTALPGLRLHDISGVKLTTNPGPCGLSSQLAAMSSLKIKCFSQSVVCCWSKELSEAVYLCIPDSRRRRDPRLR